MHLPVRILIGLCLALGAAFAGWRGARPPNPHRGPRLIPWRFVMVLMAACAILAIVGRWER